MHISLSLCTRLDLVNSNYALTYLHCLRWLIEASFLPYVLTITLFRYFLCIQNFLGTYHLFYAPSIITKVPLFILMLCAEIQSDVFVNSFQILLFNTFFYSPSKLHIYQKYTLNRKAEYLLLVCYCSLCYSLKEFK
jgi:hypothetical protein